MFFLAKKNDVQVQSRRHEVVEGGSGSVKFRSVVVERVHGKWVGWLIAGKLPPPQKKYLGGGFKDLDYFHPYFGEDSHFD